MSTYSTGSVTVRVGSSSITGQNTRFDLYVTAGDQFHLTNKPIYEVADVVSSKALTLTSRYSDSKYKTLRASEALGSTNDSSITASLTYSGTLTNTPVILSSLTINASDVTWEDNGAGVLATTSGVSLGSPGTIDYDSGSWSVSYTASPTADLNIMASYYSGDTLNGMGYKTIGDFNTHYKFPEMSPNDENIEYIYTKAMRSIDTAIFNASSFSVKASSYFQMGAHQYIFFGSVSTEATVVAVATAVDASIKGSMYLSTSPSMWLYDSDTTATRMQSY